MSTMRTDTLKSDLLPCGFTCETKWSVFTGAPCSGKTSVLLELEKSGFSWRPEVARVFIEDQLRAGKTIEQLRCDESKFQLGLMKAKLDLEEQTVPGQITLFDRGMPDSITYFRVSGLDPNLALKDCFKFKYATVFIFEPLPLVTDHARTEDQNTAEFIDFWLEEDYKSLGYEVTRVPVMSIDSRTNFILDRLRE
jgi:predicted ATPase